MPLFNQEQRKEFDSFLQTMTQLLPPPTHKEVGKEYIQECALSFIEILKEREERIKNSPAMYLKNLYTELNKYHNDTLRNHRGNE